MRCRESPPYRRTWGAARTIRHCCDCRSRGARGPDRAVEILVPSSHSSRMGSFGPSEAVKRLGARGRTAPLGRDAEPSDIRSNAIGPVAGPARSGSPISCNATGRIRIRARTGCSACSKWRVRISIEVHPTARMKEPVSKPRVGRYRVAPTWIESSPLPSITEESRGKCLIRAVGNLPVFLIRLRCSRARRCFCYLRGGPIGRAG